jgi:hypothetical protein
VLILCACWHICTGGGSSANDRSLLVETLLSFCTMHAGHSMLAQSLATVSLCLLLQQALAHRVLARAVTAPDMSHAPQQPQPVASDDGSKHYKSTVAIAIVCVILIGSLVLYGCYRMWRSGDGMRGLKPRCGC